MLLDEERDLLFVGNINSVSVIDLIRGETIEEITLTGNIVPSGNDTPFEERMQSINDLKLDREKGLLYAANSINRLVEVVDLNDFQVVDRIQFEKQPLALELDPSRTYLYIVATRLIRN